MLYLILYYVNAARDVLQFAWVKVRGSKVAYTEDPLDRIYRLTVVSIDCVSCVLVIVHV